MSYSEDNLQRGWLYISHQTAPIFGGKFYVT